MNDFAMFMQKLDVLIETNDISYKELERKLGIANGYFGKLRNRGTLPTIKKIDAIADYFHVNRDFFIGTETTTGTGYKIPLLGRVAAGIPIQATENTIGYEEIPHRLAETGAFFALLIKGDSISPDIQNGDKIIVRQQPEVENGQIAVVLIGGNDAVCKEIKKIDNGLMLISRNPNYAPMIFTPEEIRKTPIQIIGRVIEIRREL